MDILTGVIDRLQGLDRAAAYNSVLNEPDLLHDAFTTVRNQPHLFSTVLVDRAGAPIELRDDAQLTCGETFGHIKALVLRAAARRHFRQKLGKSKSVLVPVKRKIGPVRRLLEQLGLAKAPPPKKRKSPGRGDLLYNAMRDYLRYDWQARLIPHYTQFTPALVQHFGQAFLEVREPHELRVLSSDETRKNLSRGKLPLFLSPVSSVISPLDDSIDSELLWKLWEQMGLERLFGTVEANEARRMIAEIAATSKAAIGHLMQILGSDMRLFIGFFFIAFHQLGRTEYRAIFSKTGATQWMVATFCDRLRALPALPAPELESMKLAYAGVIRATNKQN